MCPSGADKNNRPKIDKSLFFSFSTEQIKKPKGCIFRKCSENVVEDRKQTKNIKNLIACPIIPLPAVSYSIVRDKREQ